MGLKGSCLCGEISYEIDSVDMPIVHCHCQTCRKAHAASFAATAGVKRENFRCGDFQPSCPNDRV